MGMDVYGLKPDSEEGKYFRASVWSWRPLARTLEKFAPDITAKIEYLQSNDGSGLNGEDSVALADVLDAQWPAIQEHLVAEQERLDALPLLPCRYCGGTGVRTDEVGVANGMVERNWCNGCDGKGEVKDTVTWYSVEPDHFREFIEFARHSGGFEIC